MKFSIDDTEKDEISGIGTDYSQKYYSLSSGFKTLKWCYEKDIAKNSGRDAGWVDKIAYNQSSSISAPTSVTATDGTYTYMVQINWVM